MLTSEILFLFLFSLKNVRRHAMLCGQWTNATNYKYNVDRGVRCAEFGMVTLIEMSRSTFKHSHSWFV